MSETRAAAFAHPEVGGRALRVAHWPGPKQGGKRPLLFFNGIGANIELMSPLAEFFPDRDILTFDMPGIGKSPKPDYPYRPWMMARYAARLLDHYGFDQVDVMGVSWGGGLAQQFAFQHAKRTHRLILCATSPGHLMVPGDWRAIAKMAHPRRYVDPAYLKKNFEALYGGETEGAEGHVGRIEAPSMRGYFFQLLAMAGWTSLPFLPFLKAPTLVLAGDRDKIVPLANGRILATLIPNARLHVVKDGGHLFIVSRARDIVPVMRDFLDAPEAARETTTSLAKAKVRPRPA